MTIAEIVAAEQFVIVAQATNPGEFVDSVIGLNGIMAVGRMLAARMRAACALSAKCLFHFRINFGLLHSIFHFIRLCFWISGNFQQRRVLHATGSYKEWSLMLISGAVGRAHSNRRRWHQYCKLPQGRGFQYLHYIRERVMKRKSFPSP